MKCGLTCVTYTLLLSCLFVKEAGGTGGGEFISVHIFVALSRCARIERVTRTGVLSGDTHTHAVRQKTKDDQNPDVLK